VKQDERLLLLSASYNSTTLWHDAHLVYL